MPASLTLRQALAIQDELLARYSRTDFQEKLRAALVQAGPDFTKQVAVRQELCLPIQGPVISKYGFEPTTQGVMMSIAAFTRQINADPKVAANHRKLNLLVNPQMQEELEAKVEQESSSRRKQKVPALPGDVKRHWIVVGGLFSGGLVVREGRELSSTALLSFGKEVRLDYGAEVEELESVGDRLHFRKISGEGPDSGWVSLMAKGSLLLEPKLRGDVDFA